MHSRFRDPDEGEVYVLEPLGFEIILDLKVGENLIKAKTPPGFGVNNGDRVWLSFDMTSRLSRPNRLMVKEHVDEGIVGVGSISSLLLRYYGITAKTREGGLGLHFKYGAPIR